MYAATANAICSLVAASGVQLWNGLPPARATANSPELLTRLARLGSGIAVVNNHFAVPYVISGELMPVLADWSPPVEVAWAVFPGRRLMPARARVFIDALAEEFSGPRCRAAEVRLKQSARRPGVPTTATDGAFMVHSCRLPIPGNIRHVPFLQAMSA